MRERESVSVPPPLSPRSHETKVVASRQSSYRSGEARRGQWGQRSIGGKFHGSSHDMEMTAG